MVNYIIKDDSLSSFVKVKKKRRIVLITSCSKSKKSYETMAENLYTGDIFLKSKKIAKNNNLHFLIISAKFGLLHPKERIKPYEKAINNKTEAKALEPQIRAKLEKFLKEKKIEKIILILGEKYFFAIKTLISQIQSRIKVYRFKSKSGFLGYKKHLNALSKMGKDYKPKIFKRFDGDMVSFSKILK